MIASGGEKMPADTVAVFDFGADGHNFSTDNSEGDSAEMLKATDISAPTGVWGDYLGLVETGNEFRLPTCPDPHFGDRTW